MILQRKCIPHLVSRKFNTSLRSEASIQFSVCPMNFPAIPAKEQVPFLAEARAEFSADTFSGAVWDTPQIAILNLTFNFG
jgi:hypothetical protein